MTRRKIFKFLNYKYLFTAIELNQIIVKQKNEMQLKKKKKKKINYKRDAMKAAIVNLWC